jgi:hypothetical protein
LLGKETHTNTNPLLPFQPVCLSSAKRLKRLLRNVDNGNHYDNPVRPGVLVFIFVLSSLLMHACSVGKRKDRG